MGAVVSCIKSLFQTIGACIMAVVNGIAGMLKAIINAIASFFGIIVSCLTSDVEEVEEEEATQRAMSEHSHPTRHQTKPARLSTTTTSYTQSSQSRTAQHLRNGCRRIMRKSLT